MARHVKRIPRRSFLKSTGTATLAGIALNFPQVVASQVISQPGRPGANQRLTIAHIGVGGMGTVHLRNMLEFQKSGQVNIAAVCDADEKRLHMFHAMYHETEGYLAATNELMGLHVDLTQRRSAPFPETARAKIEALAREHETLDRPSQSGRIIGIRRGSRSG